MKFLNIFWWIRKILYLWIRSKVIPAQLHASLDLDPGIPVCYVLRFRSLTDRAVLDHHCQQEDLPQPGAHLKKFRHHSSRKAMAISLSGAGFLQKKRSSKVPTALFQLIEKASAESFDVHVIPVSVFWGRNPGKEEKSLLKLLFFDDEHGGFLQRFLTFFAQGRNVFCHFGKPVSVRQLVQEGASVSDTAKKLRRVLRVHFHRQREMVLGPQIYDRGRVIDKMMNSKELREVILQESKKSGLSVEKTEAKARKYAEEVCAKLSHSTIRFFDLLLSWLWKKIYDGIDVRNEKQLSALAETHELVYMPCHRSHMDYLLIGYVLYYSGLLPPHTIAGINLNFWPVGPLLRRGGGVFIRRSFKGDRLYAKVVAEFVRFLIGSGFPFCFYPEGGRSRTGRLLPPKMGILSMVADACHSQPRKPVLLVPVWVGYDRLMEARSYSWELRGKSKKSESFRGLIRASKLLRSRFGKAYISFGRPLDPGPYLQEASSGQNAAVHQLAWQMSVRTNQAAVISPISLFSLILLASPRNALSEKDLLWISRLLLELLQKVPYHKDVQLLSQDDLRRNLVEVEQLSVIQRFAHPGGDVLYVSESDSLSLFYYSNNILHLMALPSLLMGCLRYSKASSREELIECCLALYPLIARELFLPWDQEECRDLLNQLIDFMTVPDLGLIFCGEEGLARPDAMSSAYTAFVVLAGMTGTMVEKYALFGTLLIEHSSAFENVHRETFLDECENMAMKLDILSGAVDTTGAARNQVTHFLNTLLSLGYIHQRESHIYVSEEMKSRIDMFMKALSPSVRDSIQRGRRTEFTDKKYAQKEPLKEIPKDETLVSG
ncbi:MAG: glycerol-3-phosphate 1-O-acyltransferase PlsB [Deltaproteobacteria bacterium]|nr:glycerol-3-phosphate 1-O-acyltransferase PlsB [Deltaproteobacteria bacterium]